jgi:hypothetical protein
MANQSPLKVTKAGATSSPANAMTWLVGHRVRSVLLVGLLVGWATSVCVAFVSYWAFLVFVLPVGFLVAGVMIAVNRRHSPLLPLMIGLGVAIIWAAITNLTTGDGNGPVAWSTAIAGTSVAIGLTLTRFIGPWALLLVGVPIFWFARGLGADVSLTAVGYAGLSIVVVLLLFKQVSLSGGGLVIGMASVAAAGVAAMFWQVVGRAPLPIGYEYLQLILRTTDGVRVLLPTFAEGVLNEPYAEKLLPPAATEILPFALSDGRSVAGISQVVSQRVAEATGGITEPLKLLVLLLVVVLTLAILILLVWLLIIITMMVLRVGLIAVARRREVKKMQVADGTESVSNAWVWLRQGLREIGEGLDEASSPARFVGLQPKSHFQDSGERFSILAALAEGAAFSPRPNVGSRGQAWAIAKELRSEALAKATWATRFRYLMGWPSK